MRQELLARRRRIPRAERDAAGTAVAGHVLELPEVAAARRVALYAAIAHELPTRPVFEALAVSGCERLLPRVDGEALAFVPVERWEELVVGPFGVPAPPDSRASVALQPDDVVLVPGLAFDRGGHRLGRGGGHYDRTFEHAGPLLVGIAFQVQLVDRVPHDSRDRRMDAIVTERGSIRGPGET